MEAPDPPRCAHCRAPLDVARAVAQRSLCCGFCHKDQDNPEPLPRHQEVLVDSGLAKELVRVTSCAGPDAITLSDGSLKALEDLIPVTGGSAAPGTEVFYKDLIGWQRSVVRDVSGDQIRVENADPSFKDPFFDKTVGPADVRVALDPDRRVQRTRSASFVRDMLRRAPAAVILLGFVLSWFYCG